MTLEPDGSLVYRFPPDDFSPRPDLSADFARQRWTGRPTPAAIGQIVAFGPKAIESLLESIDDPTETALVVRMERHGFPSDLIEQPILTGNRANAREMATIERHMPTPVERPWPLPDDLRIMEYTVTRGDLCMIALGAIVNRPYSFIVRVAKYDLALSSPSRTHELAAALRARWGGGNAAERLLDSLATDFATRGHGSIGFQAGAWMRLIEWFPDYATGTIIADLDALPLAIPGAIYSLGDDPGDMLSVDARIRFAALSGNPALELAAVQTVLRATEILDVADAIAEPIAAAVGPVVRQRLDETVGQPEPALRPYRRWYAIDALLEHWPDDAVDHLRRLARDEAPSHIFGIAFRLVDRVDDAPWAAELLIELLDDQRLVTRSNRPDLTVRDATASRLAHEWDIPWSDEAAEERRAVARTAMIERLREGPLDVEAQERPAVPSIGASMIISTDVPLRAILPASSVDTLVGLRSYGPDTVSSHVRVLIDSASGRSVNEAPLAPDVITERCGSSRLLVPNHGLSAYVFGSEEWVEVDLLHGSAVRTVAIQPAPGEDRAPAPMIKFHHDILVGPEEDMLLKVASDGTISTAPTTTGMWTEIGTLPHEPNPSDWPVDAKLIPIRGTPDAIVFASFPSTGAFRYRHATGTVEKVPGGEDKWTKAWGSLAVSGIPWGVALWDFDGHGPVTIAHKPDDLLQIDGTGFGVGARTLFALRSAGIVEVWVVDHALATHVVAELELPFDLRLDDQLDDHAGAERFEQAIIDGGTHLAVWRTARREVVDGDHIRHVAVAPTEIALFDIRPWTGAR